MKTNIHTFCQAFSSELEPYGEELRSALSGLPPREDIKQIDATVLELREIQQRLSMLREKVSEQRTFLLIFGPLKSGKSTLMNALSGAYVSEVSSLPAYPALVYVKNGEQHRFEATDYEGRKHEFPDNVAMTEAIQTDHTALADAIVTAENAGEDFDPKKHYPQAIRRMDIEVPAVNLAESGSVLVDTPGLYSRMKFGYDQMTRDFRDTAACAIFVVKTDNLFFEKVFEEFEELLSCFSRIFLVSNIDASKQDLRPDGTLEDSLESSDPGKIIDAFRSLSMSATLRGAIEDGRLQIYPIDLQSAASRTLSGGGGNDATATDDNNMPVPRDDGFDEFVTDLTAYLNSNDYLHDFMYDSLRLAQDLTAEASAMVSGDAAAALKRTNQQIQEELAHERARLAALETLEKQNWDSAFDGLRASKDRLLEELTQQNAEQIETTCEEQIAEWMESDESWNELLEKRLNPQLEQEFNRQSALLLKHLQEQTQGSHSGAEFSETQLASLRDAGLKVDEILSVKLPETDPAAQAGSLRMAVDTDDIPVNRGLGDVLLFRSRFQIRQDIFGDEGNRSIEPGIKRKRLGSNSLDKLRATARDSVGRDIPKLQRQHFDALVDTHVSKCVKALSQNISQVKAGLQESIAPVESKLAACEQAQDVFERIHSTSMRFDSELSDLQRQFDLV